MSKSGTRTFFFFWPGFHADTVGPLSWADTILARMAMPMTAITRRAPPTAAPTIVPTDAPAVEAPTEAAPAASASVCDIGDLVGDGESVGPGDSVGVIEGEAPMRIDGVGLGVSVGVWLDVTEGVGVAEVLIEGVRLAVREFVAELEALEPGEGVWDGVSVFDGVPVGVCVGVGVPVWLGVGVCVDVGVGVTVEDGEGTTTCAGRPDKRSWMATPSPARSVVHGAEPQGRAVGPA